MLDQINAWNTKVDDLGIVLDSDPRKTNAKGVQQPAPEADSGEEPELSRRTGKPDMKKTVRLPQFGRDAQVRAESFSADDNTIEIVWTTAATVRR